MGIVEHAFSINDSVFLVLLIGLAIGTWWIIRYAFKMNEKSFQTNNEREQRYIKVIEVQARAIQTVDTLKADVKDIKGLLINDNRYRGGGGR